jgi:DNA-binding CsgD family transcriptional regulator
MGPSEFLLPQEIYRDHLDSINGIKFTPREIDVISCLLHGKSLKGIADFLSTVARPIGERSIETHILNIRRKIGGSARESIINFVEKSDKYRLLRYYYQSLLIHKEFQTIITEVSLLANCQASSYLIISDPLAESCRYITFLKEHLQHLCTEVSINILDNLINSLHLMEVSNSEVIILIFSQREYLESKMTLEAFISKHISEKSHIKILLLLIGEKKELENCYSSSNLHYFQISSQADLYFLILGIIEVLFSNKAIKEILFKFKGRYSHVHDNQDISINLPSSTINNIASKESTKPLNAAFKIVRERKHSLFSFIILLSVTGFLIINKHKINNEYEFKINTPINKRSAEKISNKPITSYMPELLAGHEQFIGRDKELQLLTQNFVKNNIAIITGRAGVGKSSLAIQFGKRQKDDMIVRFFDADSISKINEKYRELASELNINTNQQNKDFIMKLVNNKLENLNYKLLFIFDNVDRYEDIKEYVANLPSNVKVLITTRKPELIADKVNITLKEFSISDAEKYIYQGLKRRNLSGENIKALVKNSSTLPYDLKCIVAYLLDNPTIDSLAVSKEIGNEIQDRLFEQFALNNSEDAKLGWKILQYAAYLDPDFIDIEIFNGLFNYDKAYISRSVNRLESLSLISITNNRKGRSGIKIHRKLQKAIRQSMRHHPSYSINENFIIDNLLRIIDKLFVEVDHNPDTNWLIIDNLQPQVKKILECVETFSKSSIKLVNLYYKLSKYNLLVSIDYIQAVKYAEKSFDSIQGKYFGNKLLIANIIENLGITYIYGDFQKINQGLSYLQESLKIKRNIHKGNHNNIAKTLRNIAYTYLKLRQLSKGLSYFKDTLSMRQAIYKGDHPDVAESLNDLAWGYYEMADYLPAADLIEKSVGMYQRLYPEGHPCTIYALHTLGALLIQANDVKRSLEVLEQALNITQRFGMESHYTTSYIYYDLGRGYLQLNDYKKALEYSEKALQIRYRLFNINKHPNQISESLEVLGDIHVALNRKNKALKLYEESLSIRLQFFSKEEKNVDQLRAKILRLKNNFSEELLYLMQ